MTESQQASWPELPTASWRDTYATLHRWTQIVGKIRLTLSPWLNHSWHVTLYVTGRGLSTSPIPYAARNFEIAFDFIDHTFKDIRQRRRNAPVRAIRTLGGELLCAHHG